MSDKKCTILCVDDEQDIVDSLYDTFMDFHNVRTATNGEEALKIFNEEDIALVITDQGMPGMSGSELLVQINEQKSACKRILLTGYTDIKTEVKGITENSADKYFSKPWDDDELLEAVEQLLKI